MALGIILGSGFSLWFIFFLCLCIVFFIFSIVIIKDHGIRDRRVLIFFLMILGFLLGMIRIRDIKYDESMVPEFDGAMKKSSVTGKVCDISYSHEQYLITLSDIHIDLQNPEPDINLTDEHDPDMKVLVYSEFPTNVLSGDLIHVKGTLYSFQQATNYGQFDQRKYYYSKNIFYKVYADEILPDRSERTPIDHLKNTMFLISDGFRDGIDVIFDNSQKGILSAMLLGNKTDIDQETKDTYKRIGIAHVLSISGLHITLIGMGLFGFLIRITRNLKASVLLSLLFILSYGILTGFAVSTQRAVIMLFCLQIAKLIGTAYDGQSAAALAAIIILFLNPRELYETGFQLSFVAVFGIFAGNEFRRNLDIKNPVFSYLIPGVSAIIATFPILLRTYYSFSPYSLIANLILLPFMSVIVISGMLSGVFGAMFVQFGYQWLLDVGFITGGPAHFLLKMYTFVSEFLLDLQYSDIITGCPSLISCFLYYGLLFLVVCNSHIFYVKQLNKKNTMAGREQSIGKLYKEKSICFGKSLLIVLLMYISVLIRKGQEGICTSFVDVGQGMSVYIETDEENILIDGGSSNVKNVGINRIEPFLLWRGTSTLRYCFVTHTDADHINGIIEIIQNGRIKIENLVLGINNDESEELILLAKNMGINVILAEKGEILGNDIYVLSPDKSFIYDDKNQASLVLKIKNNDFSILITGDSDIYAESEYVRYLSEDEKINILQCPHHGSKYSCSELLLERIKPDVTVISCSKRNSYGHPAQETLERIKQAGSECYITSLNGMVTITYDGYDTYNIKSFLERKQ